MIDERDYFEAVEQFLKSIQENDVRAVCCVALLNDPDTHDVVSAYGCGPFELSAIAGVLMLNASLSYQQANLNDFDEEDVFEFEPEEFDIEEAGECT